MAGSLQEFLRETEKSQAAGQTAHTLEFWQDIYLELQRLPKAARDFKTPEGAILCLEEAYRRRDIESAVAAKDFKTEGRMLLAKTGFRDVLNEKMITTIAETLELALRTHFSKKVPDFDGLESFFPKKEQYSENIVIVTELCRFPDGAFSRQGILVVEASPLQWRVLHTPQ